MPQPPLTWNAIRALDPCSDAVAWGETRYKQNASHPPAKVLRALIREDKLDWANWLIVRVMTYRQYVAYAIYAAEQVIDLYERSYPNDPRPRRAIEAAKRCLKNPSKKNRDAARDAARAAWAAGDAAWAAWAAGDAAWAAGDAAWAAGDAAWAAENAAWAAGDAAWAAENAAWAAGDAAWAAENAARAAWAAARKQMQRKILRYGLRLLEGSK